ncbi:response regulator [Ramlibacter monticola]|uniref:Response regulator transcription factor n=1 Tax=Ramlibacter monticola TaxID=1926872 RepID=A0A937CQ59_9BURK|nr:response regulator transcription factor [Ramlibacter monticola]MBL0390165.1 response regulator transcription factor [Ramlibacter monticola]
MSTIRLLVVEHHPLFRRGLLALLAGCHSVEVVGEAVDSTEAVRAAGALHPDMILLNDHLPGVSGINQTLLKLSAAAPHAKLVLLASNEEGPHLDAVFQARANSYLAKTIEGDMLLGVIHRVMRGELVVSPELLPRLVSKLRNADMRDEAPASGEHTEDLQGTDRLSAREQDVLQHVARGFSNKAIGRALHISDATVKAHLTNIMRKLGVSSRVQVAIVAHAGHGWTGSSPPSSGHFIQ